MGKDQTLRHILFLDDDADYRKLLVRHLGELFPGVRLTEYNPVVEGVPGPDFDWSRYDVMLLDYNLSLHNVTGLEILKNHGGRPDFPATIMLTGAGNEDLAITVMKSRIYDYLRKQNLHKEQLKEAILDAHARHIAAKRQKDAINEAREVASRAAAMAFEDYKSRYESLHAAEIKRLRDEQTRLREALEESRKMMRQVESEKQEAVQSLEDIELELMKFRNGSMGRDSMDPGEPKDRREQLNKGIEESERKRLQIEAEIQKNLWRQGQEQMKLEQIEEDLKLFNEEFKAGEKNEDGLISAREFQKMKQTKRASRQTERKKQEQDMYTDILGQLGKGEEE